jgi:hypothetical protein
LLLAWPLVPSTTPFRSGDVGKRRLDEIQLEAESMREYISGVR